MLLSLFGLMALIVVVKDLKAGTSNIPRLFFLTPLALSAAPLFLAVTRKVSALYCIPPIIAVFLLYPIFNPHGVVYGSDSIFNYRFTQSVIETAAWLPGQVIAPIETYSFYPLGNVFFAIIFQVAAIPGAVGYLWAEPLIRLFAVPGAVYAFSRRLFDGRIAIVSVLFYLGTAAILFNIPVQQGLGSIFFALSILALAIMVNAGTPTALFRARVLFLLLAPAMVITHHFTSYVFAGWLGVIALLSMLPGNRKTMEPLHLGGMFIYYFTILAAYTVVLTENIFIKQINLVFSQFSTLLQPGGASDQVAVGRTFSQFEIAWLVGSIAVLGLIALLSMRYFWGRDEQPFVVANGVAGLALVLGTLPLLATSVNYIPLRIGEYSNLVLAPLAAAAIVRWARMIGGEKTPSLPALLRENQRLSQGFIVVLVALVFMGGSMAPSASRHYFESSEFRRTDSPLLLGYDSLRGASWAQSHYSEARVWGDRLAVDAFSGFAGLQTEYGSANFFNKTSVDADIFALLEVGDYVIVNVYMTVYVPDFLHQTGPGKPLDPVDIEKFASDPHFAQVYQDSTFTIYRLMHKP